MDAIMEPYQIKNRYLMGYPPSFLPVALLLVFGPTLLDGYLGTQIRQPLSSTPYMPRDEFMTPKSS